MTYDLKSILLSMAFLTKKSKLIWSELKLDICLGQIDICLGQILERNDHTLSSKICYVGTFPFVMIFGTYLCVNSGYIPHQIH